MWNFVKILGKKARLMKQILMDGFSGTLDTGQVKDLQMMKDKLIDGKELQVDLRLNQLT